MALRRFSAGSIPVSRSKLRNPGTHWIPGFFFVYQCFAVLSEIFAVRKTSRIYDYFSHNANAFRKQNANEMLTACSVTHLYRLQAVPSAHARRTRICCSRPRPQHCICDYPNLWSKHPVYKYLNCRYQSTRRDYRRRENTNIFLHLPGF